MGGFQPEPSGFLSLPWLFPAGPERRDKGPGAVRGAFRKRWLFVRHPDGSCAPPPPTATGRPRGVARWKRAGPGRRPGEAQPREDRGGSTENSREEGSAAAASWACPDRGPRSPSRQAPGQGARCSDSRGCASGCLQIPLLTPLRGTGARGPAVRLLLLPPRSTTADKAGDAHRDALRVSFR